jgi:hypothetical protein
MPAGSVTVCLRAADAMTRMCHVLLSQGITHRAVEEPCWPQVRAAAAGLHLLLWLPAGCDAGVITEHRTTGPVRTTTGAIRTHAPGRRLPS